MRSVKFPEILDFMWSGSGLDMGIYGLQSMRTKNLTKHTAQKASVFGVILVRIQSKCGKIRTRITPNMDTLWHFVFTLFATSWKLSKCGVFSGLYFLLFGLNTEMYSINLCIRSKCRKIRTRKNSVFWHFSRSGNIYHSFVF